MFEVRCFLLEIQGAMQKTVEGQGHQEDYFIKKLILLTTSFISNFCSRKLINLRLNIEYLFVNDLKQFIVFANYISGAFIIAHCIFATNYKCFLMNNTAISGVGMPWRHLIYLVLQKVLSVLSCKKFFYSPKLFRQLL